MSKIDRKKLNESILSIFKATEIISEDDLKWLEFSLNRKDDLVSIESFRHLIESCDKYLNFSKNPELRDWDRYSLQQNIEGQLFACKGIYYKQKKVLIGIPQRTKYKNLLAPNLYGFIAPQSCRFDIDACYGLGYCESRQYFVDKALADHSFTHVMFVDDDILLPLDAIDRLLSYNEMFIGASYAKKNVLLESTATHIVPDPAFHFTNSAVVCQEGDYVPVPVNAMGLGATLINLDFFRGLPRPHFSFQFEYDRTGGRRVLVGEDSLLVQRALISSPPIQPKIIPGIVAVHTDFQDGKQFGPEWLVDPVTRKIRPKFEEKYCKFACDPRLLAFKDIDTAFQR